MSISLFRKPIAITTGDHGGIGPEVIAKGIHSLRRHLRPEELVIFGDPKLYRPFAKLLPRLQIIKGDGPPPPAQPHSLRLVVPRHQRSISRSRSSYLCGRYIELAAHQTLEGFFSAMVTGPIDKTHLRQGGYIFNGHTDMLESLCGAHGVTMMLASPKMRVSLVTTHIPLAKVSTALSTKSILKCIEHTDHGLKTLFGIQKPRIAVLGLNPHAGDQGLFGQEEIKIISPAVAQAQQKGLGAQGPFAPDGFFALWRQKHFRQFDAIVCMYHDQGLIPIKLFDFRNTVNITLGLPLIRTSVDHGVGADIVGQNRADPSSFVAALKLARRFSKHQSRGGQRGIQQEHFSGVRHQGHFSKRL